MKRREKIKRKRRERRKAKLKRIGMFLLSLLIIYSLFFFIKEVRGFLLTSPLFKIQKIKIEGVSLKNRDEIYSQLKKEKGENIFKIDIEYLKKKVEKPDIKNLTIFRKLPNTLLIKGKERRPEAFFKLNEEHFGLDREGVILKIKSLKLKVQNLKTGKLEVKGLDIRRAREGERIKKGKTDLIFRIKDNFAFLPLKGIDFSDPYKIILFLNGEREIYITPEKARETNVLKRLLVRLREKGIKYKYIDLRFNDYYIKPDESR